MTGYDPVLLDGVRKALEEEKTTVVARFAALSAQDPFADPDRLTDNAASDADAFEESNHDRVSAQTDELKAQVMAIDDALVRIGNGTYGFCVNCGNMIDTDRLAILPTATQCLDCEHKKKK
jgi:RNA polymerase-binding transcription factor DksA